MRLFWTPWEPILVSSRPSISVGDLEGPSNQKVQQVQRDERGEDGQHQAPAARRPPRLPHQDRQQCEVNDYRQDERQVHLD
jgi:hypothetical protein